MFLFGYLYFLLPTNCSFAVLGTCFCTYVMELCFHHYLCLLYTLLVLQLHLMRNCYICFHCGMFSIKIIGIYIHHGNVTFFFLVRFLLCIVDCSASCTPANVTDMFYFVALQAFLSICWASYGLKAGSTFFSNSSSQVF